MEIKSLYQPFETYYMETDQYVSKKHKKTFFELVFVLEGNGKQIINDHSLSYAPDKLFLIFPQDKHGFEVENHTKFLFIRFNDSYLKTQSRNWVQKVEYIFHNHNHMPGCILENISDKPLIRALAEAIIREQSNNTHNRDEVIAQCINTIITIAARNITIDDVANKKSDTLDESLALLNYIHQHIYEPEKLRIEEIARTFNFSANYINEYFKKHIGESLQQYITKYKVKLIKTRLKHSNMRLNEIADEFGFTDLSHMNRTFKKFTNINPTEYRKTAS